MTFDQVRLTDYFDIVSPGVKPFEGKKKYIATGSLETGKITDFEEVDFNSRPTRANMQPVEKDIMFAKMKDTEKVFVVSKEDAKNIYSTGFSVLRIKKDDQFLSKFVYFWLKSPQFQRLKNKECTGATQKALNETKLSKFTIPKPPFATQRRIVSLLEKAEELIQLREDADKQTDEYLKAVFYEMFAESFKNTDPMQLAPFISFMTSGSRGWAKFYSTNGAIFIRIQNVKNSQLHLDDIQYVRPPSNKESERTKVKENDLLVSITADLGRTAVVDSETAQKGAHINQHLVLLRLKDNIRPTYVSHYLESQFGKRQFTSLDQKGVKSGLGFKSIRLLKIHCPPLESQKKFEKIVKQIELLKENQSISGQHVSSMFNSLMQSAFKGDIIC